MLVDSYGMTSIDVCILLQEYIPRIGHVINRDEDRLPLSRKSPLDDVVTIRVDICHKGERGTVIVDAVQVSTSA